MSDCNPGFMPKLLGCTSEDDCEEVTFGCAILSLGVTLLVIFTILIVCFQTYLFIDGVQHQEKEKLRRYVNNLENKKKEN